MSIKILKTRAIKHVASNLLIDFFLSFSLFHLIHICSVQTFQPIVLNWHLYLKAMLFGYVLRYPMQDLTNLQGQFISATEMPGLVVVKVQDNIILFHHYGVFVLEAFGVKLLLVWYYFQSSYFQSSVWWYEYVKRYHYKITALSCPGQDGATQFKMFSLDSHGRNNLFPVNQEKRWLTDIYWCKWQFKKKHAGFATCSR